VNTYLKEGQYFFSDIRKEGIVLYELDDEPLAEPRPLAPADRLRIAKDHFQDRFSLSRSFLKIATSCIIEKECGFQWIGTVISASRGQAFR
jgi:hypothetical protein